MLRESEAFTQSKDPLPAYNSIGPARSFFRRSAFRDLLFPYLPSISSMTFHLG
jgi:hypothetical protein